VIGVVAEDLGDRAPDDAVLGQTEPFRVGAVGEAVAATGVDVGDHRRDGVEDQPQAAL
jgi:hypothetical protein